MGPTGNDAQQLFGYDNTQSVRQVGFINSSDEEGAAWLHTQKTTVLVHQVRETFDVLFKLHHCCRKNIPVGMFYTCEVHGYRRIYI